MEQRIKFNKLLIVLMIVVIAYFNYSVVIEEIPLNIDMNATIFIWLAKVSPFIYVLGLIIAYLRYSEDPESSVNLQRNVSIFMILVTTAIVTYSIIQGAFIATVLGGYIIPVILLMGASSLKKQLYRGL